MRALHPSETAREGKVIEQSVYIKRSDNVDHIVECAQCGFMVNLNKRSIGPSLGAIGNPTASSATVSPPSPGVSFTDTFADPVDTGSGCPFCNSMNPKGIGRDTSPWDRVNTNLENL